MKSSTLAILLPAAAMAAADAQIMTFPRRIRQEGIVSGHARLLREDVVIDQPRALRFDIPGSMSMALTEAEFSMSMGLTEAEFSMSMVAPLSLAVFEEALPTDEETELPDGEQPAAPVDEKEETEIESSSTMMKSTLYAASLFSALVFMLW